MVTQEITIISGEHLIERLSDDQAKEFKKNLSELGIKEVNINSGTISESLFSDKLSIYFHPNFRDVPLSSGYISDELKAIYTDKGFEYYDEYSILSSPDDSNVRIICENTLIGHYLPDRNQIIIYVRLWRDGYISCGLNKYMIDSIIEQLKTIKLKEVDTKPFVKKYLVQKFIKSITEKKKRLNNEIRETDKNIRGYLQSLASGKNMLRQIRAEYKGLIGIVGDMTEELEKRIEEIKILPFVKRVGLSQKGIRIDFRHVDLTWNDKKIELGECYAYLLGDSIKILNKNFVKHDGHIYHTPHVSREDGSEICFGNASDKIYSLLGEMNFRAVAHMIYMFLRTFTEDDNYCSMGNWELCKQQKDNTYMSNDYRRDEGMDLLPDTPEETEEDRAERIDNEDREEDSGEREYTTFSTETTTSGSTW